MINTLLHHHFLLTTNTGNVAPFLPDLGVRLLNSLETYLETGSEIE